MEICRAFFNWACFPVFFQYMEICRAFLTGPVFPIFFNTEKAARASVPQHSLSEKATSVFPFFNFEIWEGEGGS